MNNSKNTHESSMPNFFIVKNDTIEYHFDNVTYRVCVAQSGSRLQSITRMVESGLNHMLDYWYHTDEKIYTEVCEELYKNYINIHNFLYNTKNSGKSVYSSRKKMIDLYCYPTAPIIKYAIIHFVLDLTNCNIINKKAMTDITVTNASATAIAIASFYFKYLELFSEMNPERAIKSEIKHEKFNMLEKAIHMSISDLISFRTDTENVNNNIKDAFEVDDVSELKFDDIRDSVYGFVTDRANYLWNVSSTSGYESKFLEAGYDRNWNEYECLYAVFTSWKKYCAPLIDDKDLINKYVVNQMYKDTGNKLDASNFHYKLGVNYKDFEFATKQVSGYIQSVLQMTNGSSITKQQLPNINVHEFLHADTDSIRRQEATLLEDSKVSLYDIRVESSQMLFSSIMSELSHLAKVNNIPNVLKLADEFSLIKTHKLNSYILAKIFLSLSGERDIYKDIFGVYSKLFLALFYIRVMTDSRYITYRHIAECMRLTPSTVSGDSIKTVVDEFISSNNLDKNLSSSFQNICRSYINSVAGISSNITVSQFYDFFMFMDNPYNVRHIMNPNMYKLQKPESTDEINQNERRLVERCLNYLA